MTSAPQPTDKDELLGQLLQVLAARGLARRWADSASPYSELASECRLLSADPPLRREFGDYLRANPIIQQTVHSLLSHLMMASHGRWHDVPFPGRLIARHGSMIGRWLPTFLIIDGPLGRFLRRSDSPLNVLLRTQHARYPLLAQARDLFNHDLFRRVRNGVGHWSFTFEHQDSAEQLVCFDWDSGERTAAISILEAEGLHVASFCTIECLDHELFNHANPSA
ncbi:MAG TPA: hypothetical protein VIS96_00445 [Terrimicrobiaceae bacterium]